MESGWRKNYVRYRSYFLNVALHYKERADIKTYLEILLSLTTIIIFSVFALRPTLVTIAQLLKEIEAKEETVVRMTDKISQISQAQSLYNKQWNNIQHLKTALPEKPQPEEFVRQVEGLTEKHGITIDTVTVGKAVLLGSDTAEPATRMAKTPISESAGEVAFSINASAPITDFQTISSFYSDFMLLRRPTRIDSFVIAVNQKLTEGNRLIFTVDGRLPYLKENLQKRAVSGQAAESEVAE